MSPELERLLNALWERDNCEPRDLPKWKAAVERLIADTRSKRPGLSREAFMLAIEPRYRELCRTRKRHSAMPPRAWLLPPQCRDQARTAGGDGSAQQAVDAGAASLPHRFCRGLLLLP